MDCNKEDAVRAKGIAETKLRNRDFQLARKMAVRAQQLDPNLDNISRLIMVCDVHCSAEKKFGGETDWYGILQVQQAADEATIKKQYRKFALLLHPDKNKLPGAEAAFKLIGEAQRILLDRTSRADHDRKRSASLGRPGSQGVPFSRFTEPYGPPHGANWSSNVGVPSHFQRYFPGNSAPPQQPAQAGVFSSHQTLWTSCPFCGMKCQYYRNIINKPLTCQTCRKAFVAYDINFPAAPRASFSQRGACANEIKVDIGSKPTSTPGSQKPESFSKPSNATVKSREVNRRGRREKENSWESDILDSESSSDSENESVMCDDTESKDNQGQNKCSSEQGVRRSTRQRQRVSYKESGSDEDDISNPPKKSKGSGESLHTQNGTQEEPKSKRDDHAGRVPGVLNFPQPEFSDFGKDRGEECFAVSQVWAVYDLHDNMPRSYALIRRVFRPGSKVKITWFKPDADGVDEINWVKAGLPVAAGNFKLGKDDFIHNFRMFSHEVIWDKGPVKGPHKVFPKLGETWALFKNWDIKWSFDGADRSYEYEVVEVLCDYNEENGIEVAYLGKLKGYVSLFCRTVGRGGNIFRIRRSELYRFSHRIPSFKLTDSKGESIPVGSFELDPVSVPTNLDEIILPEKMKPESVSDGFSDQCDSNGSEDSCVPLSEASNGSQVPESVFCNFDDAKSPGNFKVGQIWALYSDEDCLPKYYGLITQVTTHPEFKLHLSWLASHSLPKGAIRWHDRNMVISCGSFRIDKADPVWYDTTDAFSHHLNASTSWEKDGTWNILPGKGEIWALYKNWNSGIRSSNLGDCDYDVVEVIEADESVITVAILERLSRFSCVHKPQFQGSSRVTSRIPLADILRFSHQVPAFQLTVQKNGSLRGCWEVDPLALPAQSFAPN